MHFFLHQWDPKSLAALDGSVLELVWGKKTPATTLLESKHKPVNPENGMVGILVFACFLGANSLLVPGRVRHSSFKAPLNFLRSWARWSFGPPAATPKSLGKLWVLGMIPANDVNEHFLDSRKSCSRGGKGFQVDRWKLGRVPFLLEILILWI